MIVSKDYVRNRFQNSRPGLLLSLIIPTEVPIRRTSVTALITQDYAYPLLNGHFLKSVSLGRSTVEEVAAHLGLEEEIIFEALAEEISNSTIIFSENKQIRLTSKGQITLTVLKKQEIRSTTMSMDVDLLIHKPVRYDTTYIATKVNKEETPNKDDLFVDQHELSRALPEKDFLKIEKSMFNLQLVNDLFASDQQRIIDIKSLGHASKARAKTWLLVFSDTSGARTELDLFVNGEISENHRNYLNSLSLDSINISLAPPAEQPSFGVVLDDLAGVITPKEQDELIEIKRNLPFVESLATELDQAPSEYRSLDTPGSFLAISATSQLSVFEHPELLANALRFTQSRLLIISPWLRRDVINRAFIADLEACLQRGVDVTLAFGYGKEEDPRDQPALMALKRLSKYGNLTIFRHDNTHSKILIADNCTVTTSFNWLSFAGDENRTYRMEEGTMVRDASFTSSVLRKYMMLFSTEATRIQ